MLLLRTTRCVLLVLMLLPLSAKSLRADDEAGEPESALRFIDEALVDSDAPECGSDTGSLEQEESEEESPEPSSVEPVLPGSALPETALPEQSTPEPTSPSAPPEAALPEPPSPKRQRLQPSPGLPSTIEAPRSPSASQLTPELQSLRAKIDSVLKDYYPKHLNTRDNSSWAVMHGIIAYGVDTQLFQGAPGGPKVNAVGWLCFNGACRGEQMLYLDHGKLAARKGPGLQGHYGQFLAILAQSHVRPDYPIRVAGKSFTVADLIEHEKQDCQPGEELTFKLIALMHYVDSDETWTSRGGEPWSIQRLVQEELKQPIRGAACGGTHRLMGFSYAVNKRVKRGKPVVGEFRRAQIFVDNYHRYTFSLQNADGSFSTEWFTRRGDSPDIDRRLKTTGHITEWLAFSLSDQELRHPKMVKAVDYLAGILASDERRKWEVGPLGHALHALAIYQSRVFVSSDAPQTADDDNAADKAVASLGE